MNEKNTFWLFIALFSVALLGALAFSSGLFNNSVTGNVVSVVSAESGSGGTSSQAPSFGEVQIVKLKVQGSSYVLEPSTFKKGVPVRIEADMSQMPGCSKSVVISAFNIRTTLSSSSNIIEFTPDKAGTFNIACSMNMYRGTFTVLDPSGAKASYVEPVKTGGMTCGGGGGASGGCGGCGG